MWHRFALQSKRVVVGGEVRPACLLINNGKIASIFPHGDCPSEDIETLQDYRDLVIMPGLVDTHVHINEPGRTEWEGFVTATKAAASGGITSLIDMPLNCTPVTTTEQALAIKREAVEGKLWVDVGFWGGLVPGNLHELRPLAEKGVFGFKAFMVHSGIDDFPLVTLADLRAAMPVIAELGLPLLVHAELEIGDIHAHDHARKYADFMHSRPDRWEYEAIRLLIDLARETGCHVHVVHLSSAQAIPLLRDARAEGVKISVETCPHYLVFASEDIADGDTRFKCTPPIRSRKNSAALWQGLKEGEIDFVVSDHSPCVPELKQLEKGDFHAAWGGIASLQFGLSSVWGAAVERGVSLVELSQWMSKHPAKFAGLGSVKGCIAVGYDADLVIWDPQAPYVVEENSIQHRNKITPYLHKQLLGVVKKTFVRGECVYENQKLASQPVGHFLVASQD